MPELVKYFTDFDAVQNGTVGRQLDQQGPTNPYEGYKRQVRQGEYLYMLLTGGFRKLMPHIHNQAEYDEFYGQYAMGMHLRYDMYALPAAIVEQ